jgi:CheY-like chemotaxis protein
MSIAHFSADKDPLPVPVDRPQRVLLYIEDNAANLELVEQLIERRSDLILLSAKAGYPGIELARSRLPEVILMDINLPDINGLAILELLRNDPVTAGIPIIALSSDAFPRHIEKGLEAGFFRYMTKPYRIDDFMQQLDETLAHAEQTNRPQSGLAPLL